ncbi:MAG: UDP-N-acetylmuramate dehydrogenase [Lachnospiraceae bacterium]|nr:UDP-N-acetylmuramate dehydrogenase [Lachnospiraceae bacterium]
MSDRIDQLREAAKEDCVTRQEPMSKHTTFRIGGPADYFAAPETEEGICNIVRYCRTHDYPFYVIGNGSNLLVADAGYRGLILQLYKNFSKIEIQPGAGQVTSEETGAQAADAAAEKAVPEKNVPEKAVPGKNASEKTVPEYSGAAADSGICIIRAEAGAMLSAIARRAQEAGLTGFEFASGIPGTLGGAVVMNAGAYGGEMKQVLLSARVLTREGEIREIPAEELELGYRTSVIPANGWIVLGAAIALRPGAPAAIRARMEELREQRVAKQPLDLPSAGSTFKRPEGYFAGKLIMDADLRGYTVGGAQVSEKHCGFVVNRGGATAADVRQLIADVAAKVKADFGVILEPEIKMLGEF